MTTRNYNGITVHTLGRTDRPHLQISQNSGSLYLRVNVMEGTPTDGEYDYAVCRAEFAVTVYEDTIGYRLVNRFGNGMSADTACEHLTSILTLEAAKRLAHQIGVKVRSASVMSRLAA